MSQGAKTCVNALKLQNCQIYYFAVLHPEMDGQCDFVCTTNVTGTNVRKDHVKIYQVIYLILNI